MGVTDARREPQPARERLDGTRGRVLVTEAGALVPVVVDRTAVPQELRRLAREVPQPKDPRRLRRGSREEERQCDTALADHGTDLAPGHVAVAGHVVDARHFVGRRVHQRRDDVVLVYELNSRVETEDL